MSAETLLARLEKVKRTGDGTWLACCPAHDDKSPSLSVRDMGDGRVLVHCFGGCSVEQVLAAVGLDFDALFPPKCVGAAAVKPVRRPFPSGDVLEAVAHEALVVELIACDMENGKGVSLSDIERLRVAVDRIREARRLANG